MPLWTMKCEKCGWQGDHVCRYDDLDKQTCRQEIEVIDKADIKSVAVGGGLAGSIENSHKEPCTGKLARTEEIETAGTTRYMWQP